MIRKHSWSWFKSHITIYKIITQRLLCRFTLHLYIKICYNPIMSMMPQMIVEYSDVRKFSCSHFDLTLFNSVLPFKKILIFILYMAWIHNFGIGKAVSYSYFVWFQEAGNRLYDKMVEKWLASKTIFLSYSLVSTVLKTMTNRILKEEETWRSLSPAFHRLGTADIKRLMHSES